MSSSSPFPRRRRWLWFTAAGLLVAAGIFVGLLLAPPVQGWLLRRFVATQPGWHLDFERIGVGPTGLDARGLAFAMPGVEASTAPVAVRIAPTRLFSQRELRVERIEASKIRLTLTPAQLSASSATAKPLPSAPFDGILRLLKAPLPWALDTAHLDGEIVVREGNVDKHRGTFSLRGGGLSSGSRGEFTYELGVDSTLVPAGPDHVLMSAGTIRVEQTTAHGIARLHLDGQVHFPHYDSLSLPDAQLHFDLAEISSGETYAAQINFGPAARLELAATLDAVRSTLSGRLTIHADQSVATQILGERLPRAALDGAVAFTLNLRNGDLDADLTGDLDVRDWEKILPELSVLDAFKGRLAAALTRRGEQLRVSSLTATLRGEHAPAALSLTFTQPFDPLHPPATPVATLALEHWPLEWANPFLSQAGLQLAPAEFAAAWTLAYDAAANVRVEPVRPATIGPVSIRGTASPDLPTVNFSLSPRLEFSRTQLFVSIPDVSATTVAGDRIDAQLTVRRDAAAGALNTSGELHATLPTLVAGPVAPLPIAAEVHWTASLAGAQLQLGAFDFSASPTTQNSTPYLALRLERPVAFDLTKRAIVPDANQPPADWLRIHLNQFPLAWLSHWLPRQLIAGTLTQGESGMGSVAEGGLALHTTVPWRLEKFSLGATGQPLFPLDAEVMPTVTFNAATSRLSGALEGIKVSDATANRIGGKIGFNVTLKDKNFTADVALDAALPHLPQTEGTFGALEASLRATFHNLSASIVGADTFALHVRNAGGELAALDAPLPFIFGLSNANMMVLSTLGPLQLKLGRLPLAWLQPWLGPLAVTGTFEPAEFQLSSAVNRYALRPVTPVKLEAVSAHQGERELLHDASLSFSPGLDLTFICITQPKFQLAYTGTAHVTDATLDFAGHRALDLDLAVGFKGNESITLPDAVELSTRADFSAMPNAVTLGLPARGTLVTRINGDLLGGQPVELWARLADLPSLAGAPPLPPVEVTLRGKISRENVFTGGVDFRLAAAPQPTDAAFDVSMNLIEGGLKITSGFRSHFLDAGQLLNVARAFTPAHSPAVAATHGPKKSEAAVAQKQSADYATLPFWGELSGSFDLDIGAVQFAPYRIDHVRGRLDASDTTLALHDLGGEMFAGRWGGELAIEHAKGNTTGEHQLSGEFHIEQFESARVVQTVFPNQLASVDAKIDVHAKVASHGNSFVSLIDQSAAEFVVDGEKGVVRLSVPKADLVSTAAVFGGTVLLSPELRALGRLLKKFAEMPVDQIRITGRRSAIGDVSLDEFRFESPQARLVGRGKIPHDPAQPLMNRPLELSLELAARDELAVILGSMSLLEKKPGADGFRAMRQPFALGGRAGAPDTAPLYDLLAKAVGGSTGTWGFLMRKVQAEVEKKKSATTGVSP